MHQQAAKIRLVADKHVDKTLLFACIQTKILDPRQLVAETVGIHHIEDIFVVHGTSHFVQILLDHLKNKHKK